MHWRQKVWSSSSAIAAFTSEVILGLELCNCCRKRPGICHNADLALTLVLHNFATVSRDDSAAWLPSSSFAQNGDAWKCCWLHFTLVIGSHSFGITVNESPSSSSQSWTADHLVCLVWPMLRYRYLSSSVATVDAVSKVECCILHWAVSSLARHSVRG